MNRTYVVGGIAVLAVVIVAAIFFLMNRGGPLAGGGTGNHAVALVDTDRTIGDPGGPIQFVEYAAPSCPFCARFNNEVLPVLKRDYIDKGKVFYVFRVFPLGPQDIAAEALARCRPKEKYFSFLDLLYQHQDIWAPDYGITNVEAGLIQVATAAGMSFDQASNCLANDTPVKTRIVKQAEEAIKLYHLAATPTFVINGKVKVGSLDKVALKRELDQILAGKQP